MATSKNRHGKQWRTLHPAVCTTAAVHNVPWSHTAMYVCICCHTQYKLFASLQKFAHFTCTNHGHTELYLVKYGQYGRLPLLKEMYNHHNKHMGWVVTSFLPVHLTQLHVHVCVGGRTLLIVNSKPNNNPQNRSTKM